MRRYIIIFQLSFIFLQILLSYNFSSAATAVLINAGNGTVVDTANNLVWLSNANCFGVQAWNDADSKAQNLSRSLSDLKF
jgi:hypothetical protein